jgi:hypothetical protein
MAKEAERYPLRHTMNPLAYRTSNNLDTISKDSNATLYTAQDMLPFAFTKNAIRPRLAHRTFSSFLFCTFLACTEVFMIILAEPTAVADGIGGRRT